jgi:hypothetical protein
MSENAKKAYEAFVGTGGKSEGGKHYVGFEELSPSGQAAWQAAVDAARDHATDEPPARAGNRTIAESKDPAVKNQDPTGAQRK